MDFQKFDNMFFKYEKEELQMHEVVDLIMDSYDGNSVKEFLHDMHKKCTEKENEKQKAVAAFAYYYVASKFDTGFVELVKKSWDDMLKIYSKLHS